MEVRDHFVAQEIIAHRSEPARTDNDYEDGADTRDESHSIRRDSFPNRHGITCYLFKVCRTT